MQNKSVFGYLFPCLIVPGPKSGDTRLVKFMILCNWLFNRQFLTSSLFQSESQCEAFHMEIGFIHMYMNPNLHVNKSNFLMKDFGLGLALKQRQKTTRKSPCWSIVCSLCCLSTFLCSCMTVTTLFIPISSFL